MEDRFKQRCYHKEVKQMFYLKFVKKYNQYMWSNGDDCYFQHSVLHNDFWGKRQQSPGLKDKNKKLMFEKDKVKTPRGIGTIEYSEGRYIVEYGEETIDELFYFHIDAYNMIEIVGNEFENPEVINNKEE